jgi:simple sugar transport system permease protein
MRLLWRKATESKLFFPLALLALILLFDSILIPRFLSIQARGGNLYGSLIDIFRNASTYMLLAIGMTLVIATGGVDLSVGAIMAIAASVAALLMNPYVLAKELPPHILRLMTDPHFTFQPL